MRVILCAIGTVGLLACGGESGSSGETNQPQQPSTTMPKPAPADPTLKTEVLRLVNQARSTGYHCKPSQFYPPVSAVTWHDTLADVATAHSKDMADKGYFDHTSLDGRTARTRILSAGYLAGMTAENISAGRTTATEVVASWLKSEGHCINIMNVNVKEIGMGYAYNANSQYRHYWTMVLANPL